MKKVLVLAGIGFVSFLFAQNVSASDINCRAINSGIEEYSEYQEKIDNLFISLENKSLQTQKNYYLKIKNVTEHFLANSGDNKGKKTITIIGYLSCSNIESFETIFSEEIGLIEKYYEHLSYYKQEAYGFISEQNLSEAYSLKYKPDMSFDDFTMLYESNTDVYYNISGIEFIGDDTYQFRIISSILGDKPESYSVSMKIIDKKLKTLSTEKYDSYILEEIMVGDYRVYLEWNSGDEKLYIEHRGNKKLIDSFSYIIENKNLFPTGMYGLNSIDSNNFSYNSGIDETSFYNIMEGKKVTMELAYKLGKSNNGILYGCSTSGMISSGEILILNSSDLSIIKSINGGVDSCNYKNNILEYTVYNTELYKQTEHKIDMNELLK